MLTAFLYVVLGLALVAGRVAHPRYGYFAWSPSAAVVALLVTLYATGRVPVW